MLSFDTPEGIRHIRFRIFFSTLISPNSRSGANGTQKQHAAFRPGSNVVRWNGDDSRNDKNNNKKTDTKIRNNFFLSFFFVDKLISIAEESHCYAPSSPEMNGIRGKRKMDQKLSCICIAGRRIPQRRVSVTCHIPDRLYSQKSVASAKTLSLARSHISYAVCLCLLFNFDVWFVFIIRRRYRN